MATPFKGRIKMYNPEKRFGFIQQTGGGDDIHFDERTVTGTPEKDAEVEGEHAPGPKGPSATRVRVLSATSSSTGAELAKTGQPVKPYYSDPQKKQIRPELLCEEAENWAHTINQERVGSRDKLNSSSQLRRFFEEVRTLEKIVKSRGFEVARPLIRMLAAKAHYANGREKIGRAFLEYLSSNAKFIQDEKDFDAFVKGFEAIVGYFYFLNPKRG